MTYEQKWYRTLFCGDKLLTQQRRNEQQTIPPLESQNGILERNLLSVIWGTGLTFVYG